MQKKKWLKSISVFLMSTGMAIPLALAQGSLGRITGVQPERGLVEIDGGVYSLTIEAIKAGASPNKTIHSFKEGHIVRYTANNQRLEAITLLDKLNALPN